jgi:hypothetical protein
MQIERHINSYKDELAQPLSAGPWPPRVTLQECPTCQPCHIPLGRVKVSGQMQHEAWLGRISYELQVVLIVSICSVRYQHPGHQIAAPPPQHTRGAPEQVPPTTSQSKFKVRVQLQQTPKVSSFCLGAEEQVRPAGEACMKAYD